MAEKLPDSFIHKLTRITDQLPIGHYELAHEVDENIYRLSRDPALLNFLRHYFKAEPVLLESTLMITGDHEVQGCNSQNVFHFDYAGWDSLNVFVYLTDVHEGESAHMVVRGSHRQLRWWDLLRGTISDEEAERRFGDRITTIAGPAGTVFLENTEAFHKRHPGKARRVMLNLLYASHRSWLSHGRSSREHLRRRARIYQAAQAAAEKTSRQESTQQTLDAG